MYIILRIGDKKLLHENRDFFSAINQKKKNGAAAQWSSWCTKVVKTTNFVVNVERFTHFL
jgi:hypothetical protein